LAAGVGADLKVMEHDTWKMRGTGPFVFAQVKHGVGVEEIIAHNHSCLAARDGRETLMVVQ